ncbi:MAG: sigma-70 family RNA polymerase sigma factor [Planctomycetes bacterium]|nr:sigma-70 family RNA polymerase sigma factor [Planctomycetota bacterium]
MTNNLPPSARLSLLFHFCRMQLPVIGLPFDGFRNHLERTFGVFEAKTPSVSWEGYLANLYALDWFLCCGCIEGDGKAWEVLFATRTGRSDCLLIDALRARAVRLYPRNEEKQENAVADFWSHLIVSESPGSVPIMKRYDGQRPLAPWLIRVFQNWHVSQLRSQSGVQSLPDEDIPMPLPERDTGETRWHDAFCLAAREWLGELSESELLLLGMRWRYRLSQREVAKMLDVHEGTISRQTDKLRDQALEQIGQKLVTEGWAGDDLAGYVLTEMGSLLMDDPRLSADQLTALLKKRGIAKIPASVEP